MAKGKLEKGKRRDKMVDDLRKIRRRIGQAEKQLREIRAHLRELQQTAQKALGKK
jgi:flagellar biosynthesis chaperone FliJ